MKFLILSLILAPNLVFPWLRSGIALVGAGVAWTAVVWIFHAFAIGGCDGFGCLGVVLLTGTASVALAVAFAAGVLVLVMGRWGQLTEVKLIVWLVNPVVFFLVMEVLLGGRFLQRFL